MVLSQFKFEYRNRRRATLSLLLFALSKALSVAIYDYAYVKLGGYESLHGHRRWRVRKLPRATSSLSVPELLENNNENNIRRNVAVMAKKECDF